MQTGAINLSWNGELFYLGQSNKKKNKKIWKLKKLILCRQFLSL